MSDPNDLLADQPGDDEFVSGLKKRLRKDRQMRSKLPDELWSVFYSSKLDTNPADGRCVVAVDGATICWGVGRGVVNGEKLEFIAHSHTRWRELMFDVGLLIRHNKNLKEKIKELTKQDSKS